MWHIVEPVTPLRTGWAFDAMCEHLEAITYGDITRLLMNVPPGSTKSFLTDVFWPAWEWTACGLSHMRYVAFSYSPHITRRDNRRMRDIIKSPLCQALWPISLVKDSEELITNTRTGSKFATSVGGVGTGERGDRIILDDPHNVKQAESELIRKGTVEWFRSAMSNRLNDLDKSAIAVVMQRVHEEDVSGYILSKDLGYEHLMIPAEFEPDRACVTSIGWMDPRIKEGESFWPERFPDHVLAAERTNLGSYNYAGQYLQRPEPRGGGILKREHWSLWDDDAARLNGVSAGKYPVFEYLLASLDTAYTEKQENDPSALTIWGVWINARQRKRVMLVSAWAEHLELNALVEKVAASCKRFKVDKLLIEAKASGLSVAQEIRRLHAREDWSVQVVNPGAQDKVARAYQVQPIFEAGIVSAPDRTWADAVIGECATFPRGKHDDRVDSTTQALSFLRSSGLLVFDSEAQFDINQEATHRGGDAPPLYPA